MDIRSLRYFTETVRLGSFTDAARQLGVTQSTISKMIRQLEDELGETLIWRDLRPLSMTSTGEVVYERGCEILLAVERLHQEILETQAVSRGSLALGMPPMINLLFTDVLKKFREKYPGIQLQLHERTGRQVEALVASRELAAGMTVLPADAQPGLAMATVASHRVWALAGPGVFKSDADTVTLRALAQLPLILLNEDFALTRLIRRHFLRSDREPQVAAQSGQWDWTVAMARAGMGVALLPEPFVERISTKGLVCKPIVQPEILWQVGLLWNAQRATPALLAWLELCENLLGGDWPEHNEQ